MSKSKKTEVKKVSLKKELSEKISLQLKANLDGSLKEFLGEKKFESRIRKAAKLLTDGIKLKPSGKTDKKAAKIRKQEPEATGS